MRHQSSMDKIHPTTTSSQSQDNFSWAKVCQLRRSRKPRVKVSTHVLSQNLLGESADVVSLKGIVSGISVTPKNRSTRRPVAEEVAGKETSLGDVLSLVLGERCAGLEGRFGTRSQR